MSSWCFFSNPFEKCASQDFNIKPMNNHLFMIACSIIPTQSSYPAGFTKPCFVCFRFHINGRFKVRQAVGVWKFLNLRHLWQWQAAKGYFPWNPGWLRKGSLFHGNIPHIQKWIYIIYIVFHSRKTTKNMFFHIAQLCYILKVIAYQRLGQLHFGRQSMTRLWPKVGPGWSCYTVR